MESFYCPANTSGNEIVTKILGRRNKKGPNLKRFDPFSFSEWC